MTIHRALIITTACLLASCEQAPAPKPRDPVFVSTADLVAAYEGNEASAQARFSGQLLAVTAKVRSVKLDSSDKPFVNLDASSLLPVQANFLPGHEGEAQWLSKGETWTFVCESVSEVLGTPMLADCYILDGSKGMEPKSGVAKKLSQFRYPSEPADTL